MGRKFLQRRTNVFGSFGSIVRVPPNGRINILEFVGEGDSLAAALQISPDTDDARNSSCFSSSNYLLDLVREIRVIQVRVRVVKHNCQLQCAARSRALQW